MPLPIQAVRWVSENAQALGFSLREHDEILEVLDCISPLRPKSTYDSRKRLRLVIHGPLPTNVKGRTYGIPIEVWLTPQGHPEIYVKPTAAMQTAKWIGADGRVPVPPKKQSLLQTLIEVSEVFNRHPPLFMKPKAIDLLSNPNTSPSSSNNLAETSKEKILSKIDDKIEATGISLKNAHGDDRSTLEHAGRVLSRVEKAMEREKSELEQAVKDYKSNIDVLRQSLEGANTVIRSVKQFPQDLPVEKLVAVDPGVYRKYEAESEDRAANYAIAVLSKALDTESISLETFLKQTRGLAREQFLCRAALKQMT